MYVFVCLNYRKFKTQLLQESSDCAAFAQVEALLRLPMKKTNKNKTTDVLINNTTIKKIITGFTLVCCTWVQVIWTWLNMPPLLLRFSPRCGFNRAHSSRSSSTDEFIERQTFFHPLVGVIQDAIELTVGDPLADYWHILWSGFNRLNLRRSVLRVR